MSKRKLIAAVVLGTLFLGAEGHGQEAAYERYLLAGDLKNGGIAEGPAIANENLLFVTLANGRQVAENSLTDYLSPQALPRMNAGVPPGLQAVRVAAWVKTRDRRGVIRRLHGTGVWGEREIPNGILFSLSEGRLVWEAWGSNARNHSLRGARRVNDGRWHHVVAVSQLASWPWSVVALYVDGKLDAWCRAYDCNMTPQKVIHDDAFGFAGQMSRLELRALGGKLQYFTSSGEKVQAIDTDPLYDPTTIPIVEPLPPRKQRLAKTRGVVSVEDHGAAGNGIADDTQAILRAIAALDPRRGVDTLFFPGGTYKVGQPLHLPSGIDVVGLGATLWREGGAAVELVGDVHDSSFRGMAFYGGPPAAVFQHGGTARRLYFERCDFSAPDDGKLPPNDANGYRGRTSDGLLFTDVRDSTVLGCTATAGRAGTAVEGHMENLSVLRCLIQHGPSLTGFYFDAPGSGPALLLNNTVNCNKGYALTARVVEDLMVRGLSTEGMGVSLPKEAATGPMYDIRNGTRVSLELISLANLQLGRPGYQHQTWEGPQLRLNGRDNTISGAWLFAEGPDPFGGLRDATLESDDPNLVLWQVGFDKARLALSGLARRRAVVASKFLDGEYSAVSFEGQVRKDIAPGCEPLSPARRGDPPIFGPPAPRFTWGELDLKSVRDFGATGDGRTDDSAAFQRAAALSDVVYVPAGTYRMNSPVAALRMVGEGEERTILVAHKTCPGVLRFPRSPDVYGGLLCDLTLRGGTYGVYVPCNTAGWFVSRVRFENSQVAGFAADSFDHGNVLVDCEFKGGQYGFVAGGWNRHFVDKTTLWRCSFDGQGENGIRIAPADEGHGQLLYLHTMLRDCVVRNSGGPGVVMMGHPALFNFLDHCRLENCGQQEGAPSVKFLPSGYATALMYHSQVLHTKGPQPAVMLDVQGHYYTRLVEVQITGAKGNIALRSDSPVAWLEKVVTDGTLQAPGNSQLVFANPPHTAQPFGTKAPTGGSKGQWIIEHSRWSGSCQPV